MAQSEQLARPWPPCIPAKQLNRQRRTTESTAKRHRTISAYVALSAAPSEQLGRGGIRAHAPAEVGLAGGAHFVEAADGGNARRLVQ